MDFYSVASSRPFTHGQISWLIIWFLFAEIPTDFSHHPRFHGFCRHKRVVPHHVFLEGGRTVSRFHKLATDVSSSRECNQYCCQRADCSLAFIMRDKCYGVICPDDGVCETGETKRVPLHLEIALLQRRGMFVILYN